MRACINDVPKIKIGKNQNQNWALSGRGFKTSRLRYVIFVKMLPNQRSPQGLIFKKIKIKKVLFARSKAFRMLHARGQSTAVQQQHVDSLHRHTIRTTSAGMTHANGPTARRNRYLSQLVVGTGATSGVELWRRRYNPKGDGC